MGWHHQLIDSDLHVIGYIQNGDPGAVGAGMTWIDTSGGAGNWIIKIRNDADLGWETVSGGSVVPGQLFLSAAGGWPSTALGCAEPAKTEWGANDIDLYVAAFDQAATEYMQWTVAMPSDWDAGTVAAVFHWTVTGGGAAEVIRWALQGISYGDGDAVDQAWGAAQVIDDAWVANNDKYETGSTPAITIAGAGASNLVQFRAYCDAANSNLSSDGLLIGVMVTFTRT